ncbi:hypothetical protein RRG08_010235 [Elysia crispata]|uniref:Uncharacterized protein n=1 Tax=Elysia crispata TaxID=231223 RepID=A0AAE0YZR7_9GAST|nr:hypothetical protein RRG08_010235 [Elysia crispata]
MEIGVMSLACIIPREFTSRQLPVPGESAGIWTMVKAARYAQVCLYGQVNLVSGGDWNLCVPHLTAQLARSAGYLPIMLETRRLIVFFGWRGQICAQFV